ncbi:MAG: MATE family efflux transporter [Calditrichaeota bacterium]|nr:MAG: MATE family efflux transporter [Calditrichota bacterium]MBL1205331.1 MATE family efflux transporter [Calditrichota bacterium]NOG45160.1 MATE family efflux transporter [Calditrichota bacterium]
MRKNSLKELLSIISESLKGGEKDFTTGSIGKAVFLLSVPMILEMALESIFTVVDAFFVGRLGSDALAAVGVTDAVITLIFAVAIGISMGTTAMVSRRIGEKNPEAASTAAAQSIWLGVFIAIPFAVFGLIFPKEILGLMGATEQVVETGWGFTAMLLGGNITIMLLFILNAVFRGAGDAVIAMRVLWIANGINIILDPLLIFGIGPFPELGVTGAAVATTIGRGTGVLLQLYVLFSGKGRIKVSKENMKLDLKILFRLIKVSIGGVFQFIISTSSWVALVRILALFGSAALAGYTIAIRIIIFAILPSWGMANAATTLVGQNLGAGNPDRAEKSVWITGFSNFFFLVMVAAVFITIPEYLVGIFTTDPETLAIGSTALRIISYGYGFYAFGMVMIQAFNGAGDTYTPTKINFFIYWMFQIPLAFILSKGFAGVKDVLSWLGQWLFDRDILLFPNTESILHEQGVFWAIMIAEAMLTIVGVIVFKRGKWKEKQV